MQSSIELNYILNDWLLSCDHLVGFDGADLQYFCVFCNKRWDESPYEG